MILHLDTRHGLTLLYRRWCKSENLPVISAEEAAYEDITDAQRQWLAQFVERWDAMVERARASRHRRRA